MSGPCLAAFPRFAFNPDSGECESFIFGGCLGNENNFETVEECEAACATPTLDGPDPVRGICRMPLEPGPCRRTVRKWGFSERDDRRCVGFIYGGCGGNRNRFDTKEECQKACT